MNEYIVNTTKEEVSLDDIINICKITFDKLKVENPVFNITIVDNLRIREINKKYRKKDEETDVISFAFEEVSEFRESGNIRFLGEIYISVDKAASQAKEYGHSIKRELCFLTVHGLLHILGYNHIKKSDRLIMRKLEEEILEVYNLRKGVN